MEKKSFFLLFFLLGGIFISVYFLYLDSRASFMVAQVERGAIRDSVTGNLKVHASATYDLRAEVNARVDWVALPPLGGTISVEENQSLIKFVQDDLDRSLQRLFLDKKQFNERTEIGSTAEKLLEIKKLELSTTAELAKNDKVSSYDLKLLTNEVDRLIREVKLEKLSRDHFHENFNFSMANLKAEIDKRSIKSPIAGDFSSCLVSPGNQVFSGNIVGRVFSKTRIIEVVLNEEEFDGLNVGLSAGVTFFSHANQIFEAEVSALSASVDPASGMRKLFLKMKEDRLSIPVGSSGRAEIIKSKKNQALLVPSKSLIGDYVVVERAGIVEFRKVVVGARNLQMIEILEGLEEGERVVIETPHLLKNGERIQSVLIKKE